MSDLVEIPGLKLHTLFDLVSSLRECGKADLAERYEAIIDQPIQLIGNTPAVAL
ncbi:hypothetical protein [Xanthomonas hortorum]|uniref:hypothetical protein n=1 Tax=Xanthomonas hortorum TaxID=56454 RepID=UPI0015D59CA4|nr:hypothetical protein [Xanthomonas hortorum]MCE4358963.1 hypothetical protein [Xanthomonas hortorum pv. taraxaci]CAD0331673.1 hypothetical protein NCPPB940_22440 [Xanthomonas hortorum pv. taraxaci]CAD0331680.1 hypothetical protein NCPPB940_22440 [Xanthomonas hortorum pv. taraxaci]